MLPVELSGRGQSKIKEDIISNVKKITFIILTLVAISV